MLLLPLTAHSQRKLSLLHLPRYWLSSQYQALRNGRQRHLRSPTCSGLSNPVVNAICCSSGEPVSKWAERRSAPWPGLRTRWRSGCPSSILGNQRIGEQQELAHDSGDRHLRRLAGLAELAILPGQVGITGDR